MKTFRYFSVKTCMQWSTQFLYSSCNIPYGWCNPTSYLSVLILREHKECKPLFQSNSNFNLNDTTNVCKCNLKNVSQNWCWYHQMAFDWEISHTKQLYSKDHLQAFYGLRFHVQDLSLSVQQTCMAHCHQSKQCRSFKGETPF